jgi:CheY-like chemotaxis protein
VVIRVRDDGQGIAPDLLPNLFDLFVQGPQTGNRPQSGLGVGLALVKSIVTLHGGTVEAKSPGLGRGSELIVRIPALSHRAPHKDEDLPSQPPAAKDRKRILVIDDNVDACEMLAELLRELGHDVDIAHDGLEALRQLEAQPVEVAILDLGLPFIDGLELARRVCKRRAGSRPRLIALTGYGGERAEAQSRAVGFDVHLVKPVDMSALIAALEADVVPRQEF